MISRRLRRYSLLLVLTFPSPDVLTAVRSQRPTEPRIDPRILRLGVSADEILSARMDAEKPQLVRGLGTQFRLYATHLHPLDMLPHWLVVGESNGPRILFAFRVGHDIAPDLDTLAPLDMLRALAGRFCLNIHIGERSERILVLTTEGTGERVSYPPGFAITDSVSTFGLYLSGSVVALHLILDTTLYGEYLQKLKV
jgi:hypothetical protein